MKETPCRTLEGMTEFDYPKNTYQAIHRDNDGEEFLLSELQNVQVMLDTFQYSQKPTKPQTAVMSRRIEKLAVCLSLNDLMYRVGVHGQAFIPATMDGLGRSARNWVHQQVFCLDFDNKEEKDKITLEEFYERCTTLGIHPAFVYLTFSHSSELDKFRAVFVVSQVIVDIRLRNLVMLLLMELFPECDPPCKDASRIFYGGKGIHSENLQSRINPIQLLNALLKETKKSDPKNFARTKVSLGKKLGIDFGNGDFGVQVIQYVDPKNEGNLFRSLLDKEQHQKSSFSRVLYAGQIYEISWVESKPKDSIVPPGTNGSIPKTPLKVSLKKPHNPKTNLSPDDISKLHQSCRLFEEFHHGGKRLPKLHRRILLSNLRWFRNGMTVYREGLAHFDSSSNYPDPYPCNDRDLIQCADRYNFSPEGCFNCPYSKDCTHHTNLIQQIRLRKGACRIVDTLAPRVSLDVARIEVKDALDHILIQNAAVNDFSIVRADCGVGKTEDMLNLLSQLDGVCFSFPTHKLAQEAYERFLSLGTDVPYFLWPERPALPEAFQRELEWQDRIGLPRTQAIYEAALNCVEVQASPVWVSAIEGYLEAYSAIHMQSRIFCTHEKAVRLMNGGNSRIKTWIFDEDPMQCLFKINQIRIQDVQSIVEQMKNDPEAPKPVVDLLKDAVDCEPNMLMIPDSVSIPYGSLDSYLGNNDISTPVLSLLDCTGYIKPQWKEGSEAKDIFCITHRELSTNFKYVVLSATPILPLYQKAYGERVKLWNTSPVEFKGKLILHRGKSYSKQVIAELGKDFIPLVEEFVEKYGLDGLITYKDWAKGDLGNTTLKGSDKKIPVFSTFGATEGFNTASGKNIGVIGTPRLPEYALMLLGHAAGVSVSPADFELKCRTVRRHEFEVSLHCVSDDEFFQALEFAVVEGSLQQAVGRARLLENGSEVHVFSNYVLSGGELWRTVE